MNIDKATEKLIVCSPPASKNFISLVGNSYGKLTVLSFFGKSCYGKLYYRCSCNCGNNCVISANELRNGDTTSCGCFQRIGASVRFFKHDLSNRKFGSLLAIEKIKHNNRMCWKCLCDCGNITKVSTSDLLDKKSTSCGCVRNKALASNKAIDFSDKVIGHIKVIKISSKKNNNRNNFWECLCECGKLIIASSSQLSNSCISCGCKTSYYLSKAGNGTGIPYEMFPLHLFLRRSYKALEIKSKNIVKYNNICQITGRKLKSDGIHAHHLCSIQQLKCLSKIKTMKDYLNAEIEIQQSFFDADNITILCPEEHRLLHKKIGKIITKEDSMTYIINRRLELGTDYLFNSKCG